MSTDLPFTSLSLLTAQSAAAAAAVPGTQLSKRVLYKSIVGQGALLQQSGCTKKVTQHGCFVLDHVCRRGYNLKNICINPMTSHDKMTINASHDICESTSNSQAESSEDKNDD